jgi:ferrous iron transport protein A
MHKPQTLSAIKSGKSVRILRMGPCQGMRTRLTEMGLMPGVMVEVQANLHRGPVVVAVGGGRVVVGRGMAEQIEVE